jgi:hypothetical protein
VHLHSITNILITPIPSKLSHLAEKMARTSQSNPDDGSRSVISRLERYQILEKKRSIAATPPQIITQVVRDKKPATTTNDDVFSPLSTATLATSLEDNDEDDNSNDDGDGNDDGNRSSICGGECNDFAAAAAKSTHEDNDYSNDDSNDGSNGGGKSNNQKYDKDFDGGGGM